jgi:hypothetical protein
MKPEHLQEFPDDDTPQVPPELIRALTRLRESDVVVQSSTDAAILESARARMAGIRANRRFPIAAWLLWPLAAAACFLVAWLTLGQPTPIAPSRPALAKEEDAASIILREFSALYPNQIKAIIRSGTGIQLELADQPGPERGKPLVLKVCDPHGCEEIITFSGQSIEIAGRSVTVRAENGNRVILDGDEFLWSSDFNGNPAPGIHIESRRL